MKERPIFPLLVSMALPMVLSMTVNALYNIVDSFFVAQISEQAMTALSLVYPVQNMINAIAIGFGVGINALIALYSGAGDRCRADTAATHGLVFSILHGLIAAVVCIAMMPGFLRLFTGDEAVIALGVRYSSIAFFFAPVIMAELCFEKLFQAVGRMNETMAALLCGSITNIILDPVLIFGLGPFPMLGISGAALATGIGQCVTLSVYLIIYCTHRFPVQLRLSCIKPDWRPSFTPSAFPPFSTWRCPRCWFLSSTLCWPLTRRGMWSFWVFIISCKPSCTCPRAALCRACAPSSAIITVPGSMAA